MDRHYGVAVKFREHVTDHESKIRNYDQYNPADGGPQSAREQEWDDVSKALHEQEFGSSRSCPTCGGGMYLMDDRYTCVNCGATMGEYRPRAPMRREVHVRRSRRAVR